MTMVEMMALAMAEHDGCEWEDGADGWRYYFNDAHRNQYRSRAIAVLNAMRDATNNMCEAGSIGPTERADPLPAITTSQADAAWTAMIYAAIAEARAANAISNRRA